jgi:hypothetical protein
MAQALRRRGASGRRKLVAVAKFFLDFAVFPAIEERIEI